MSLSCASARRGGVSAFAPPPVGLLVRVGDVVHRLSARADAARMDDGCRRGAVPVPGWFTVARGGRAGLKYLCVRATFHFARDVAVRESDLGSLRCCHVCMLSIYFN
ncbi:hypothetical protein BDA96_01G012600 [Sorghum bicolor]|uniref:Uncharacterized protein n=1 Tax=Sorghum bicolor TaxID=4558 RepID=A0A921RV18_SORBI|nr:hypothetical protein BDA96_01G012600 [Sorghum bicolor]